MLAGCNYFTQGTQLISFNCVKTQFGVFTHCIWCYSFNIRKKEICFIKDFRNSLRLEILFTSKISKHHMFLLNQYEHKWGRDRISHAREILFFKKMVTERFKKDPCFWVAVFPAVVVMLSRLALTSREGPGGHIVDHIVCCKNWLMELMEVLCV